MNISGNHFLPNESPGNGFTDLSPSLCYEVEELDFEADGLAASGHDNATGLLFP